MIINPIGGTTPRSAVRAPAGRGGFRVETGRPAALAATGAVSMPGLLGLQEAESDAVGDREARRQADEMLDALRAMQADMLAAGGADGGEGLGRAASLARAARPAADPALRDLQRAVLLRVAVEAARRKA